MKKNTNNAKKTQTNACSMEAMEARAMFSTTAPAVVGYLPDYAVSALKNEATGKLDKLDWSTVTQINYFAIIPTSTGVMPTVTCTEGVNDFEQMNKVVAEAHAHNVKVSIVVGGAYQDQTLTDIIQMPSIHDDFAQNLHTFANQHGFDGVDLDWEKQNPSQSDIDNYASLLGTVKNELRPAGIKLSAAVYGTQVARNGNWSDRVYQLDAAAASNLDQIGIMDYDLDYSDHSPVAASEQYMQEWATQLGSANASKMLMGVPFYGKAGYGWDDGQNASVNYSDLTDRYLQNHSTLPATVNSMNTAFDGVLGGESYTWHFNGVNDIKAKTQFAMNQNYAGVMAWDLGGDHVTGTNNVSGAKDAYSLLAAIGNVTGGHSTTPVAPITPTVPTTPTNSNTASISGLVFYDGNWNGDVDQEELDNNVLYGWESDRTVWLDSNDNGQLDSGERTTTTDHDGKYKFDGLAAGTYHVCALEHAGYFFTTPRSLDVEVTNGQQLGNVFFGELVTYRHIH